MGKSRKIVMYTDGRKTELTTDIADEGRQALAYEMLFYMAENGAVATVDGKKVPLSKSSLKTAEQEGTRMTIQSLPGILNGTAPTAGILRRKGNSRWATVAILGILCRSLL